MKSKFFKIKQRLNHIVSGKKVIIAASLAFLTNKIFAQGGQAGLQAATSEIISYADDVGNLIIAVGAIVGFVGAIRVYVKWQSGDQDTQKSVMGWVGACIFLVVSGVVIKAFFGV